MAHEFILVNQPLKRNWKKRRGTGCVMKGKKAAYAISVITLAPVMALIVATILFFYDAAFFDGWFWYAAVLFFLTLVPLSAYGLEKIIPAVRVRGREGERKLAFIMAMVGFTLGLIFALLFHAPRGPLLIFLTYFFTGISLTLFNLFHIKASGHACGFIGPVVLLLYCSKFQFWYLLLLLPVIYWARMKMKRHTIGELAVGTLVGIIVPLVSIFLESLVR